MSIQNRKEREREFRKKTIIDAAEKIFFEHGFEKATMADIARESELSKGTLYLYFKNKSEICHAIILRSLHIFRDMLDSQINKPSSGIDKLRTFVSVFIRFTGKYPDHYRALLNFRYNMLDCSKEGELYQKSIRTNTLINEILIKTIRAGIRDGSIRPEIDPVKVSYSLWGNNTGILPGYILKQDLESDDSEPDPAETIRYFFQLICNYLDARGVDER